MYVTYITKLTYNELNFSNSIMRKSCESLNLNREKNIIIELHWNGFVLKKKLPKLTRQNSDKCVSL